MKTFLYETIEFVFIYQTINSTVERSLEIVLENIFNGKMIQCRYDAEVFLHIDLDSCIQVLV